MASVVNPPPLRVPKLISSDPEANAAYQALLTVVRQLWARSGADVLLSDGMETAPALGFSSEPGLGLYHPEPGAIGITSGGQDVVYFSPDGLQIFNLLPSSAVYNDAAGNLESYQLTDGQLLMGDTGGAPLPATITGTANQVTVMNGPGSITLGTSQSIGIGSSPTFVDLTLSSFTAFSFIYASTGGAINNTATALDGQLLIGSTGANPVLSTLTGALNSITFVNTAGSITASISLTYPGQVSITTLGTITTGTWHGTPIDLASYVSGNLAVSHLNGGTSASATTFWRGDGTWAVPAVPASGVWTPTITSVANVAATTAYPCTYGRVGDTVVFSGKVAIDPTTLATLTQIGISLPIASNFANDYNGAGTANAATINASAGIYADATNDRLTLEFVPTDVSNNVWWFTGSYRVI